VTQDQRVNAMTVDVEDYFHVSAFEPYISRDRWDSLPCRVEDNTRKVLDLFAAHRVRATFFVLGWVAERYPALVRDIVACGHELACHGRDHTRVTEQTPGQFRDDIRYSKQLLEDCAGVPVIGYRAASYSIGAGNLWALASLQEAGFAYSSSIYPIRHDIYGMPDGSRFPFHPDNAPELLEIPVSTTCLGTKRLPCGGGGYFRLLPLAYYRWAIGRVNRMEQQSTVFYFHPWEIDPDQPRQQGLDLKTRFRHYLNLHKTEAKLSRLLRDFQWDTMAAVFLPEREAGNGHRRAD
jgi:polysaccharide deacetylase family protein (PEP-CTERM system associated)